MMVLSPEANLQAPTREATVILVTLKLREKKILIISHRQHISLFQLAVRPIAKDGGLAASEEPRPPFLSRLATFALLTWLVRTNQTIH